MDPTYSYFVLGIKAINKLWAFDEFPAFLYTAWTKYDLIGRDAPQTVFI